MSPHGICIPIIGKCAESLARGTKCSRSYPGPQRPISIYCCFFCGSKGTCICPSYHIGIPIIGKCPHITSSCHQAAGNHPCPQRPISIYCRLFGRSIIYTRAIITTHGIRIAIIGKSRYFPTRSGQSTCGRPGAQRPITIYCRFFHSSKYCAAGSIGTSTYCIRIAIIGKCRQSHTCCNQCSSGCLLHPCSRSSVAAYRCMLSVGGFSSSAGPRPRTAAYYIRIAIIGKISMPILRCDKCAICYSAPRAQASTCHSCTCRGIYYSYRWVHADRIRYRRRSTWCHPQRQHSLLRRSLTTHHQFKMRILKSCPRAIGEEWRLNLGEFHVFCQQILRILYCRLIITHRLRSICQRTPLR